MEGTMEEPKQQTAPRLRGLYSKVNISVRTLNIIIVVLAALLLACMAYGVTKGGFHVSFDAQGGTAVEPQTRMYGELLDEPDPPTREGFEFDGWYLDPGGTLPWDAEKDTVSESMTLYAKWKEK